MFTLLQFTLPRSASNHLNTNVNTTAKNTLWDNVPHEGVSNKHYWTAPKIPTGCPHTFCYTIIFLCFEAKHITLWSVNIQRSLSKQATLYIIQYKAACHVFFKIPASGEVISLVLFPHEMWMAVYSCYVSWNHRCYPSSPGY